MPPQLGRLLIALGIALVIIGLAITFARPLRLGWLPGDFTCSGRNWQVSIPLGTSIVLSIILTILLNLWLARRR